jgi:hypothetical protein
VRVLVALPDWPRADVTERARAASEPQSLGSAP